jgi:hypothetical protein
MARLAALAAPAWPAPSGALIQILSFHFLYRLASFFGTNVVANAVRKPVKECNNKQNNK